MKPIRRKEDEERTGFLEEDDEESRPSDHFNCMSLLSPSSINRGDKKLAEVHERWIEEQRRNAARMGRMLRSGKKAQLDRAVKENLGRYKAHYINEMGLSRPMEVGRILMSIWETPLSKASLSWLGSEWRPSDILHLLLSLSTRGVLPPLGRRSSRAISEAVLEQEAAEYQSTVPMCEGEGSENKEWDSMVMRVRGAANKMGGVVNRARRMSYAAMEMAVEELMREGGAARAAEFMVALAGSREGVDRLGREWRSRTGPVRVPVGLDEIGSDLWDTRGSTHRHVM